MGESSDAHSGPWDAPTTGNLAATEKLRRLRPHLQAGRPRLHDLTRRIDPQKRLRKLLAPNDDTGLGRHGPADILLKNLFSKRDWSDSSSASRNRSTAAASIETELETAIRISCLIPCRSFDLSAWGEPKPRTSSITSYLSATRGTHLSFAASVAWSRASLRRLNSLDFSSPSAGVGALMG
jgi:hypothetical protein